MGSFVPPGSASAAAADTSLPRVMAATDSDPVNDATAVDDAELVLTPLPGGVYGGTIRLLRRSSGTPDFKVGLKVSAGGTVRLWQDLGSSSPTEKSSEQFFIFQNPGVDSTYATVLHFVAEVPEGGTLTVVWAQSSTDAGTDTLRLRGSSIVIDSYSV